MCFSRRCDDRQRITAPADVQKRPFRGTEGAWKGREGKRKEEKKGGEGCGSNLHLLLTYYPQTRAVWTNRVHGFPKQRPSSQPTNVRPVKAGSVYRRSCVSVHAHGSCCDHGPSSRVRNPQQQPRSRAMVRNKGG